MPLNSDYIQSTKKRKQELIDKETQEKNFEYLKQSLQRKF